MKKYNPYSENFCDEMIRLSGKGKRKTMRKKKVSNNVVIPMSVPTGEKEALVDVHAVKDTRGLKINRVGVTNVRWPVTIRQKSGGAQVVHATFAMYAALPKHIKGTNMSRHIQVLADVSKGEAISGENFKTILKQLQEQLESDDVYIRAKFPYTIKKITPATHREHLAVVDCAFVGSLYHKQYSFITETNTYVASYCPCSKEMCLTDKVAGVGKGAHAQRGLISLQVRTDPPQPGLWLEDMIKLSEDSGSAPLYPLLKRPDEKFVTEQGYDNPKYVEDISRDVVLKVKELPEVRWVHVAVSNEESIHPHDVESIIEISKKGGSWRQTNRGHW